MKNSRSMDLQAVALDRLIGVVWLPLIADELQRGASTRATIRIGTDGDADFFQGRIP